MDLTDVVLNLSLILLGLVIAIYAIGLPIVNNLLRSNRLRLQRRVNEVQKEIRRLSQESTGSELVIGASNELKGLIKEQNEIISTESNLKLKKAVFLPSISFFSVIILIIFYNDILLILKDSLNLSYVIGINIEYYISLIILLFLLYGGICMINTLLAIEYVSINVPLPIIQVSFPNEEKSLTLDAGEFSINVEIFNEGYELAEVVDVFLTFPPNLIVAETEDYNVYQVPNNNIDDPNHWKVSYHTDLIHMGCIETILIQLTALPIPGNYIIPVYVLEKKIGETEHRLEIIIR